jgi:hypothetical protein
MVRRETGQNGVSWFGVKQPTVLITELTATTVFTSMVTTRKMP